MAKALFLEGIDGSGKSTHIKLLDAHLKKRGEQVLLLREPGGSEYYEAIRRHIHFTAYPRPPISDALACGAGIAANIQMTREALAANQWVISDRSYHSNTLYQINSGADPKSTQIINTIALGGFKYDYKILIDIPVEVAQQRLERIGKKRDRYESLGRSYFEKIREGYLRIAKKENFIVVDGTLDPDALHQQIIEAIGQA